MCNGQPVVSKNKTGKLIISGKLILHLQTL